MNRTHKAIILTVFAPFAIEILWQWLEVRIYGEIQIRSVDNIIGLILILSIWLNIFYWWKDKED